MTWHAQDGELVLQGDEAELFREAILGMCDEIEDAEDDEDSAFGGATVFDRMTRTQQLASLEVVSRHLFHHTAECLDLTAWSEATLASILNEIRNLVTVEVDEGDSENYRNTILAALGDDLEIDNDAPKDWNWLLEAYEDRFLWDNDFESDRIYDLAPEHAEVMRHMMSITDDYYTAIPPDFDHERDIYAGRKKVWMAIDGKKLVRMTASITCEVPASFEVRRELDDLQTLQGFFPSLIIMWH